jgi:hypothetical protein
MTAPSRDDDALDGSPAHQARLSCSPINPVFQLKKTFFSIRSHVIGDARSAQPNRFRENSPQRFVQSREVVVS